MTYLVHLVHRARQGLPDFLVGELSAFLWEHLVLVFWDPQGPLVHQGLQDPLGHLDHPGHRDPLVSLEALL